MEYTIMPNKDDPAGHLKKYAWKAGESGNPKGRPLGSKNKVKYTKEAFEEAAGLSPGEMLAQIAARHFAQGTSQGDALCIKAITEANKYLEPTQDAKTAAEDKAEDMSDAELMRRLLDLTEEDEFEVAIIEKDDTATKH
jgi:transcription-repair coupling factor (superfamily II helicase)